MNTSLLEDENTIENFKEYWVYIKSLIYSYENELVWWENCAKIHIKRFFIREGKRKSREKYGLIEYLECKMKRLYVEMENDNVLNYQEVRSLKDTIDRLKGDILEGVQIRTKIQENKYGEMPSSFLVSKLKVENTKKAIYKLVAENDYEHITTGDILDSTEQINMYASDFFKQLYQYEHTDDSDQNIFINSLSRIISDNDNEILIEDIECDEVESILKTVDSKKSPGIDGIPYEFYQKVWDIIKDEFLSVIAVMKDQLTLSETQNLAVITLQPKEGDTQKLSNWRPISLLCCDYKILAKIIANRFKNIIPNIISKEQFCCPGKNNCR